MTPVRIEKLAATGEGIARTSEGVGFIDRALPGELVETSMYERRKKFWRGSLRAVLEPSPDRVDGGHAACAGCDWAHFEVAAARRVKGELFLETMQRIGRLDPTPFGKPSVLASPEGYRLRTRLHVSGRGASTRLGYFAPGTHRIVEADGCAAIAPATRVLLPEVRASIAASDAETAEVAILEDLAGHRRLIRASGAVSPAETAELSRSLAGPFQGVRIRDLEGSILLDRGDRRLSMAVGTRSFQVSVDSFFQANRHLVSELAADVEREAGRYPAGDALDAFGGVGLFAGALLSAGHRAVSVESDPEVVADARATRETWAERERWVVEGSAIADFLRRDDRMFEGVVVDPPRTGLGAELAGELARRARLFFLYIACDPATLARDLPAIQAAGFQIRSTRLYDLFAFTHRIEALVALDRVP